MSDLNIRQAYSEVEEFLNLLEYSYINKIPKKLRDFLSSEKDLKHKIYINPSISIKEQNFKRETLAIIAFLNLKYWCEDESEKQRLMKVYKDNKIKNIGNTNG